MAYNRPASLVRLLASINQADFPPALEIPLVISIDKSGQNEMSRIAHSFEWSYGTKDIIMQEKRLGLMGHFQFCLSLSESYGSIIFLEDDLFVSPAFYRYTMQALDYYKNNEQIGAFSLYALQLNGFTNRPFYPIIDKSDVFFSQAGWFKGMIITAQQWKNFANWNKSKTAVPDPAIPEAWHQLGPEEWYPLFSSFLTQKKKYFLYPRDSLVTDFGDAGMHFREETNLFQANVVLESKTFHFVTLDQSLAVYDAFLELMPARFQSNHPALSAYEIAVDLQASKQPHQLGADHVLTTRPTRQSIIEFGARMKPLEVNVLQNIGGRGIHLSRKRDLRWDWRADWKIQLVHNQLRVTRESNLTKHFKQKWMTRFEECGFLD